VVSFLNTASALLNLLARYIELKIKMKEAEARDKEEEGGES